MGSFLGAFPHLFVSTTSLVYIVFSRLFVCNVGQMAIIYIFFFKCNIREYAGMKCLGTIALA